VPMPQHDDPIEMVAVAIDPIAASRPSCRTSLRSVGSMATPRMGSVLPDQRKLHVGVLTVHVKRARRLVPMDRNGLSDPFVVLKLSARRTRYRTSIKKETLDPVWDQFFEFRGSVGEFVANDLSIKVYDWDRLSPTNDYLGECTLPLGGLLEQSKLRFQATPLQNVAHGEIDIAVRFEQEAIAFAFPSPVADSAAAAIDARTPSTARWWEGVRDWTLRLERERVFTILTAAWVLCVIGAIGCLISLFPMQMGIVPWTAFGTAEATTKRYWALVNGVVCALFTWQNLLTWPWRASVAIHLCGCSGHDNGPSKDFYGTDVRPNRPGATRVCLASTPRLCPLLPAR